MVFPVVQSGFVRVAWIAEPHSVKLNRFLERGQGGSTRGILDVMRVVHVGESPLHRAQRLLEDVVDADQPLYGLQEHD